MVIRTLLPLGLVLVGTTSGLAADRDAALDILVEAERSADSVAATPAESVLLRRGVDRALSLLDPWGDAARILEASLSMEKSSDESPGLRRSIAAARSILAFEPAMEAKLPVGFPAPTALGEIEVKCYPRYRLAETPMSGAVGRGAFWLLFAHIKKHDIPMTAPVEMTYDASDAGRSRGTKMAFLYQSPEVGQAGPQDGIEVVDVDEVRVISIGVRGYSTERRVAEARSRLEEWLDTQDSFEPAGDLRVMGYNSPMVRESRRFFEVQIPVKRRVPPRIATL